MRTLFEIIEAENEYIHIPVYDLGGKLGCRVCAEKRGYDKQAAFLLRAYHKMSVTAITALFATLVWTAATIRFITQTPRVMKNKGNALTIGFVRAFLDFSENKLRQIRVKRRF